jgi:hypothetical protein
MKKFLGAVVSVAVAQMDHGSGHDMRGTKGQTGHQEMMKSHVGKQVMT